jgi:acyl-CoA thioester hydrolase
MISCDVQIRVRYGETDRMGYAYYGFYPLYYEVGRTELLRQYGLAYKDIEDSGVLLPVADMHVDYYAPANYDELITIRTTITEKPGVKILFLYELFNSKNELINKATTTLVFVRSSDRKPCRPPKTFNDIMEKAFKQ